MKYYFERINDAIDEFPSLVIPAVLILGFVILALFVVGAITDPSFYSSPRDNPSFEDIQKTFFLMQTIAAALLLLGLVALIVYFKKVLEEIREVKKFYTKIPIFQSNYII